MSPAGKFFAAIGFLSAAGAMVALGVHELHGRHGRGVETSAESREIIAELAPQKVNTERASLRWQAAPVEERSSADEGEADRLRAELEREDRSAWSKLVERLKVW